MNKNLELLFNYYKEGKITEYTLCSELEDHLQTNLRTKVIIDTENSGAASSSFVVALIPIRTDAGYKVEYVIDKKILQVNTLTAAEVIEIIEFVKNEEQRILSVFLKELKKIPDVDMTLRDALIIYTKIYRMCLDAYPYQVRNKLANLKLLDTELIDNNIDKLMGFDERTEHIIEALVVNNIIPNNYIIEARKLAYHSNEANQLLSNDTFPSVNTMEVKFGRTETGLKSLADTVEVDLEKVLQKNN